MVITYRPVTVKPNLPLIDAVPAGVAQAFAPCCGNRRKCGMLAVGANGTRKIDPIFQPMHGSLFTWRSYSRLSFLLCSWAFLPRCSPPRRMSTPIWKRKSKITTAITEAASAALALPVHLGHRTGCRRRQHHLPDRHSGKTPAPPTAGAASSPATG